MKELLLLWTKEPARIVGIVVALLALLVAFGVQVSTEQQTAVVGLVTAIVILLGGEITRSQVYSPHTVETIMANDPPAVTNPDDEVVPYVPEDYVSE